MSPNSLYILPSNYCPLNCTHCAIQDKREVRYDLDLQVVEELIQDAKIQRFSCSIISGGGEPFAVDEATLVRILHSNQSKNLYSKITTNAYWASSYDEACRRLIPLKEHGLNHLVISVSESHQEFVKYNYILNAVKAANHLNLNCDLYLTTLNRRTNPLMGIIQYFIQHSQPLPYIFAEYYFIPFGNAEKNFELSDFQLTDISKIAGACPSIGHNICVHPNGTVTPCAMVFSLHIEALHIGNVYQDSLADIMERVHNSQLVQWISRYGVVSLKEVIEENTEIKLPNKYVNICHLCSNILQNREALNFLRKIDFI